MADSTIDRPAHVQRMVEEYLEGRERLRKLDAFINSDVYNGLDKKDRCLLANQSLAMAVYLNVLGERLMRAGETVDFI